MFYLSDNNIITLSRGDSFTVPLFINRGTVLEEVRYNLKTGDKVFFALLEPNQKFEDAILKKVYTKDSEQTSEGDILISVSSTDTENLVEGLYYYTIKLKRKNGDVHTVVPQRQFNIVWGNNERLWRLYKR